MDNQEPVKDDPRKVVTLKRNTPSPEELQKLWLQQQEQAAIAEKHKMVEFVESVKDAIVKGDVKGLVVMAFGDTFPSYQMSGRVDGTELITIAEIVKTVVISKLVSTHA